ncbi:MAG: DUF2188 domain-containing protein, partial [Candidatus Phytoplasma sp.]|nr:DUF2188 domain-containing protein [Phytoplasma sp.]
MGFWFFKRKKKKQEVVEETKVEKDLEQEVKEVPTEKPKAVEKKVKAEETVEDDVSEDAEVDAKETKKQVANKYHISQNKDEKSPHFKSWRVRKAGSNKTIKYFETQAEAIKFAEGLAERNDGSI